MSTGFESRNVRFSITDPHANMAHDDGLLSRVSTITNNISRALVLVYPALCPSCASLSGPGSQAGVQAARLATRLFRPLYVLRGSGTGWERGCSQAM